MPLWVKLLLLGLGLIFLTVGAIVGLFGTREAQTRVALIESLRPLSAAALEEQPSGTRALVEGGVSPRNRVVFRNFVAYVREELDVTTESDGDSYESWRSDGRITPGLALEASGVVLVGNQSYSIARGHEVWYDDSTLGFDRRPRDGSKRYHGLLAGRPVVAFGTVVEGPEGKELSAETLFGGSREEYLASQREAIAFMRSFGAIFGTVGLLLSAIGALFMLRR